MPPRDTLFVRQSVFAAPGSQPVEVVERERLGHPDTLCDAIAKRIDVRVVPKIRRALTSLFARGGAAPLANDTSCGVGFAPRTDLEKVVLGVERRLNAASTKRDHPALGADVKVTGIRRSGRIRPLGCALIGRHLASLADYAAEKDAARALALSAAALEIDATVNAADGPGIGDVFPTVAGTSAEAGDDGEVGRDNRTNGLITSYGLMTMEAAAGKNPVNHVGKLYNVLADRIAERLVAERASWAPRASW